MTVFYTPITSSFGQNVRFNAGSKLFFFVTGTTTPKTTFADAAETVPNTDPVIADSRGRFGPIFITGAYDVELKDANDVQIWKVIGLTSSGVTGSVIFLGNFDSSTNAGDYPASGAKGDLFVVTTGFTLNSASGSHILSTRDFIIANTDGATGVDSDWDIIRGVNTPRLEEVSIRPYDIARAYSIGDYAVASDFKIYRALVAQTGNDPAGGGDPTNWLPVADLLNILTSTDTTRGLAAAQGKVLKDLIDNPVPATTTTQGVVFIFKRIILSNGSDTSNDINFSVGNFSFSDGSGSAENSSILTKQLDNTWALGNNLGGLADTLIKAANTTYHCFAMSNALGTVVDFGYDTSITAANLLVDTAAIAAFGASFKVSRQGSTSTDSTPDIKPFFQTDKRFTLKTRLLSPDTFGGTSAETFLVDTPFGLETIFIGRILGRGGGSGAFLIFSALDEVDIAPVEANADLGLTNTALVDTVPLEIKTNLLSQIRGRTSSSSGAITENLVTKAWIDFSLEE